MSDIAIAGAHGQIAQRLTSRLIAAGDGVRGLIRNPEQAETIRALGAAPVLADLEALSADALAETLVGADVVVFAAGAGPGSTAERKQTVDRDGAVKLIDAARTAGVDRYVLVSGITPDPIPDDDVFRAYLRAKAEADEALRSSGLDWTVFRPGELTNEPGSGRVRISLEPFHGKVTRDDAAEVLAAVIHEPRTVGRDIYVINGTDDEPIPAVLASALGE